MAPVKVQLLCDSPRGQHASGSLVTIDIHASTPLLEVKRQLQVATGLPVEHQKVNSSSSREGRQQHDAFQHIPHGVPQVMLSGINQLVLIDKRHMKAAHCGTASSLHFAVTSPPKEGTA